MRICPTTGQDLFCIEGHCDAGGMASAVCEGGTKAGKPAVAGRGAMEASPNIPANIGFAAADGFAAVNQLGGNPVLALPMEGPADGPGMPIIEAPGMPIIEAPEGGMPIGEEEGMSPMPWAEAPENDQSMLLRPSATASICFGSMFVPCMGGPESLRATIPRQQRTQRPKRQARQIRSERQFRQKKKQ